ncbi:MAG TPA: hypothetical protein VFY32_07145 [Solirubrobacteraceae bacterium]|nr:hypothetical protein [Solirubrobacteraceae bacterium]
MQQGLGRIGAGVDAEQDGRLAGVEQERLSARAVLLPGAVDAWMIERLWAPSI